MGENNLHTDIDIPTIHVLNEYDNPHEEHIV